MMKWMIGLTCLFSPLAIRAQSATAPQPEKKSLSAFYESQFKKYPVAASGVGVKASLLLQTNQKARQYKTRLTEAWVGAKEPNFAGHYVAIDQIGCGTGCVVIFIVDWNTGRISTPPRDAAFQFRKASRLIVLNPYDECTVYGPPILYEFVDGFFRKVENEIKCDGA